MNSPSKEVRETSTRDLPLVEHIHREAFGHEDEACLVREILSDPSARPTLSLMAFEDAAPQGHVLFSKAYLTDGGRTPDAALLAPLAVLPAAQGRGIGSALVMSGFEELRRSGVALVFVLGDPAYYARFGFVAAGPRGLEAPFPLPEAWREAWMVAVLDDSPSDLFHGKVHCCTALSKPEFWRE